MLDAGITTGPPLRGTIGLRDRIKNREGEHGSIKAGTLKALNEKRPTKPNSRLSTVAAFEKMDGFNLGNHGKGPPKKNLFFFPPRGGGGFGGRI